MHLLPTLWFRNTWIWGCAHEGCWMKPLIRLAKDNTLQTEHVTLGRFRFAADVASDGSGYDWLFTDNVTNTERLYGVPNEWPYVKDAFHRYVVDGETAAVNPRLFGTKVAAHYRLEIPAKAEVTIRLRLFAEAESPGEIFGEAFSRVVAERKEESEQFYAQVIPAELGAAGATDRPASLRGPAVDEAVLPLRRRRLAQGRSQLPPAARVAQDRAQRGLAPSVQPRRALGSRQVGVPLVCRVGPGVSHDPLRPAGPRLRQGPAHAPAARVVHAPQRADPGLRVRPGGRQSSGPCLGLLAGLQDDRTAGRARLAFSFQHLPEAPDQFHLVGQSQGRPRQAPVLGRLPGAGQHRRVRPLPAACPTAACLEQADGTAWMAFYCATMLAMALELSRFDPAAEDIASKFFEHFVYIADAINTIGGTGLWDEEDGFYYDQMYVDGRRIPLRVRSMVGLIPLFTVQVLTDELIGGLHGFQKRLDWFLTYRRDLAKHISYMETMDENASRGRHLLAIPSRQRLERVLRYVLDENEFLSPYGIRSLVEVPPRQPLRLPLQRSGVPGGVRSRRIEHEPLWRQLQLARPDLVPRELSAHRGPGAVSLLLRRQPEGRVSDRLGPVDEPGRGGAGIVLATGEALPAQPRATGVPIKATRRVPPSLQTATTSCSSTSIFTARRGPGSGPATRQAGRAWSPTVCGKPFATKWLRNMASVGFSEEVSRSSSPASLLAG